jgi:clan AA aspartic protease (TIGR02281 family)
MGALANMIGVGCIVGVGLALSDFASTGPSARAPVGPPVLPDDVLASIPAPPRPKPRTASYSGDRYGQFYLWGIANGVSLIFIVDTGASGVVLCRRDAQRVGFDVAGLSFDHVVTLANGDTVHIASARLTRFSVEPLAAVADMPVEILDAETCAPLLGMSFLRRRADMHITNDTLTLSGKP